MIERLVLAGIAIAAIWFVGTLLRRHSRDRLNRVGATRSLSRSVDGLPQIVSFYGPQCGVCDVQRGILEHLQEFQPQTASVRFVDAAAETGYALQYGVYIVPTTIVASATGRIVGITCGLAASDVLAEQLQLAA